MPLTNRRNRLIYRLWSPVYDLVLGRFFAPGRRRALELIDLQPNERVLLAGVGTGADLPLLPPGVCAVGVDLSAEMIGHARGRRLAGGVTVSLVLGDAQRLPLCDGAFDAVILNLILSVVPDARLCLHEALRMLKPGGRIVIFDKFRPEAGQLGTARRRLNRLTLLFGTDITRRLSDILGGTLCTVLHEERSILSGAYRVILLEKPK